MLAHDISGLPVISDRTLRRFMRSEALVALTGDLIRALLWTALAALVCLSVAYDASLVRRMYGQLHMNDFGRFYYSARAFLDGADMYGPTPATAIGVGAETFHLWNMNPPQFHLLILPLALLPPAGALAAWGAMNALALGFAFRAIGRQLAWSWSAACVAWVITAIALASPTGILAITGQVTFVLMWPITCAWAAWRDGRARTTGWLLGLVAAVKPFLGLFAVYFLLTRRWREAAGMLAAGALSVVAGLMVFGVNAYASWLRVVSAVDWGFAPMNASLLGIVSRTFAENPIFLPLVSAPGLVRPLWLGGSAVVLGLTAFAVRRDASRDRGFALLALAALLVSPLGWMYYAWWVAAPLCALVPSAISGRLNGRGLLWAATLPGLLLPLYVTTAGAANAWGAVTLGSVYGWTLLALWCALVIEAIPQSAEKHRTTPEPAA